jgi:hypothetical protein
MSGEYIIVTLTGISVRRVARLHRNCVCLSFITRAPVTTVRVPQQYYKFTRISLLTTDWKKQYPRIH